MDTYIIPAVTGTGIIALVSLLFSLAFQYIPGLNTWFAPKTEEFKKGTFLLVGLLAGLVWFLLCSLQIPVTWGVSCAPMSVGTLLLALVQVVLGAGGVQGFYKVLPTPTAVRVLKASRAGG